MISTFAKKEMSRVDKELWFICLDLSNRNLLMFAAHNSSTCFSATVLTPVWKPSYYHQVKSALNLELLN